MKPIWERDHTDTKPIVHGHREFSPDDSIPDFLPPMPKVSGSTLDGPNKLC